MRNFLIFILTVSFILTFLLIINIKLEAQGPYYDELLLAIPAFAYKGIPVTMFNKFSVYEIPVFANSILGAVKTAVYGIYLVLSGNEFTISSWRTTAILIYSLGLISFIYVTGRIWKKKYILLLTLFLVTDIDVLLNVRFDHGPVAMAFLYKYILLILIIRTEIKNKINSFQSFLVGLVTGLIIFDKLSSVVILVPFTIFTAAWIKKKIMSFKNLHLSIFGLLTGLFPIIIGNLWYLVKENRLFSTEDLVRNNLHSWSSFRFFIKSYLTLGSGYDSVNAMLGQNILSYTSELNLYFLSFFIICLVILNILYYRKKRTIHLSMYLLLSFISVGLLLYIMPQQTYERHYLLGTPFQYLSILLIFDLINQVFIKNKPGYWLVSAVSLLQVIWLTIRMSNLLQTASYLMAEKSSIYWDPSFNIIGEFAKKNRSNSFFIASDWGVATQIFAYANGSPNLVFELFPGYQNSNQLYNVIRNSHKNNIYILGINPPTKIYSNNTNKIENDAQSAIYLKLVQSESELQNLSTVRIKKYEFIPEIKSSY